MRHRVAHRKLGRTTEHRLSLLRNLSASLIAHERIRTTEAKAKELRPFVEKLVTLGKRDSLHARRRALSILSDKAAVGRLFGTISPRFSERPGGYTRILKLGSRQGDGAPMAFIEFVDFEFKSGTGSAAAPAETKKKEKPKAKKKDDEPEEAVEAAADEVEEATPKSKAKKAAKKKKATKKKATKKKPEA